MADDPYSGAAGAGASILQAGLGFIGQNATNQFNRRMAREQMDFQERMSNTAWQRAIADMRKAGINPMLSVSQGAASSPTGVNIPAQNPLSGLGSAAHTGFAVAMNNAQLDLLREQANTTRQQGNMYGQQANLNLANMNNAVTSGQILENQLPGSGIQRDIDAGQFGTALAYAKRLGIDVSSAISLLKILRSPTGRSSVTDFVNGNTGVVNTKYTTNR